MIELPRQRHRTQYHAHRACAPSLRQMDASRPLSWISYLGRVDVAALASLRGKGHLATATPRIYIKNNLETNTILRNSKVT